MGADIHSILEVNENDELGWYAPIHSFWFNEVFSYDLPIERNYDAFAKLAGVRGNGPPPKGLPDDVSVSVMKALQSEDFHSHSYVPLSEYIEAYFPKNERERYIAHCNLKGLDNLSENEMNTYNLLNSTQRVIELIQEYKTQDTDFRVVFTFDN